MRPIVALLLFVAVLPAIAAAQQSVEAHGQFTRTIHTGQESWGLGAQYQSTFGAKNAPVRLAASLGGDWARQEGSGQTTTSVGVDLVVQPGGSAAFTPFIGGGASLNWLSGNGAPSGTQSGFEGIVGLQYTPHPNSPVNLDVQVRPGYVKTQEHAMSYRLGIAYSFH